MWLCLMTHFKHGNSNSTETPHLMPHLVIIFEYNSKNSCLSSAVYMDAPDQIGPEVYF